ncbi:MAG: prepilin-type N-terminal cleavage/methylation domain-containing protein [Candidatus Rokubacteria bacterium]|nr:prepilin-type N-terminal cleavage/methylation domain-containing protein [Candidatus Rokubacteria bacterium]
MDERGLTLVEVLVAIVILVVGLLGLAGTLAVQGGGAAAAVSAGHAGITRGYYVSTATMLAQQRLEAVKRLQYWVGPPAGDEYGSDPTPTGFPDEPAGTIPGYPNFIRQVRVQTGVPAANMKTVTVTVGFNLPTQMGINREGGVAVSTLIAARP